MKLAILVYQAGIANVFRVERMHNPMMPTRLMQADFKTCESFCNGMAIAGVIVRSMSCNRAGDVALFQHEWTMNLDCAPFRESMRPVVAMHHAVWPESDRLFTDVLNGSRIAYAGTTDFLVQIGKDKGSYKTVHKITGNLGQAVKLYQGYNIGNGYKKRLLMPSCSKNPVLAKQAS